MLNQVTAVFTRRQINIESLNVSASSIKGVHKYTITAWTDKDIIEKVVKQIEKKIDVIQAHYFTACSFPLWEIHVLSRCHSVRAACSGPTAASQAVTAAAGPSITLLLVGFLSLAGSCWCPGPRAGLSAWQLSETAAPCPLAESRPCCTSGTSCTKDLLADGAPSSAGNTLRRKEKMILSAF